MADKKKKPSKLKQFARQYRHLWLADHLYIECPRPQFETLQESGWAPRDQETFVALQGKIKKHGRFKHFSHFYHKKHKAYYVIDHLWMSTLASWGNSEMQEYMRIMLSRTLSKTFTKPIKAKSSNEYALVVDTVDSETLESVKKKEAVQTGNQEEKHLSLLDKVKDDVQQEDFLEKYGISKSVYDNMLGDAYLITTNEGSLHILDICKFLYSQEGVKMNDIYTALKEESIISQPPIALGGQHNIYLCSQWKEEDNGFQVEKKDSTYPAFYKKGIVMLGMILHEKGLTKKYLLPK